MGAKFAIAAYLALSALCWQFELTNSRTSTLWKLNPESGKITTGHVRQAPNGRGAMGDRGDERRPPGEKEDPTPGEAYAYDEVFYIISTTSSQGAGAGWVRQSPENYLPDPEMLLRTNSSGDSEDDSGDGGRRNESDKHVAAPSVKTSLIVDEKLDCGKPVNFTYYDYLIGVGQRFNHPIVPEPEVAYLFLKTKDEDAFRNFDIGALERRLKRAKREKPRSVNLYNQIGNYYRIVGNARESIECFRRALAMSPTNSDVLLNLARVLFNLQYLDDAIHLTRRSLEMQPPGRSAWQQYFTLGEIFKAYGHFQESILHLRHALELFPEHEPILKALRDVENSPSAAVHIYTVVIIVALVVAVFVIIMSSSSSNERYFLTGGGMDYEHRTQRHFNRAMAMRSLKGFSTARNLRHRRY